MSFNHFYPRPWLGLNWTLAWTGPCLGLDFIFSTFCSILAHYQVKVLKLRNYGNMATLFSLFSNYYNL
jgi:hypothetical protein